MKTLVIVLAALATPGPAAAQTATPPVPSAPSAASTTAPAPPQAADPDDDRSEKGQGGGVKALRLSCREEAKAKGLKGPDRREAVSACVVRQRPDLAGREQCRTQGFGKGLRKDELHAFVKECLKSKG